MAFDNTKNLFGDTSVLQTNKTYRAQADNIILDKVVGPFEGTDESLARIVSGDIFNATNSTIYGADDIIDGSKVNLKNATIFGDANVITQGKFFGGDDSISINNILPFMKQYESNFISGDILGTEYVDTFQGGNDTIIVHGDILQQPSQAGFTYIYGDLFHFSGNTFVGGNDTITIKGNVSRTGIYGDFLSYSPGGNLSGGNDIITIGTAQKPSEVFDSAIVLGTGNDKLTIYGTVEETRIHGGNGNDSITIGTLITSSSTGSIQGGGIIGGAGFDSLKITGKINTALDLAAITLGFEQYTFAEITKGGSLKLVDATPTLPTYNITKLSGGIIEGSMINDTVKISTLQSGTVKGNDGNDRIDIVTMQGGAIRSGNGDDIVSVKTLTKGSITGGEGFDTFLYNKTLTNTYTIDSSAFPDFEAFGITVLASGGKLQGTNNADNLVIDTVSGGTVDGRAGADKIHILSNVQKPVTIVNNAVPIDTVYLQEGIATNGKITLSSSSSGFILAESQGASATQYVGFDMKGGNITGSAAKDTLHIDVLTAGSINAKAGNDAIFINSIKGGTVLGDVGNDQYTITNLEGGTINGGNAADRITITQVKGKASVIEGGADAAIDNIILTNAVATFQGQAVATTIKNNGTVADIVSLKGGIQAGGTVTLVSNYGFIVGKEQLQSATKVGFDMSGGSLIGSKGADSIHVGILFNGSVGGGAGNDTIIINTLVNADVYGGAGADRITVENFDSGIVYGGDGNDIFYANAIEVTYDGGGGNDHIIFTHDASSTGIDLKDIKSISIEKLTFQSLADREWFFGNDAQKEDVSIIDVGNANIYTSNSAQDTHMDTLRLVNTVEVSSTLHLTNRGTVNDMVFFENGLSGVGSNVDKEVRLYTGTGGFTLAKSFDGTQYTGFDLTDIKIILPFSYSTAVASTNEIYINTLTNSSIESNNMLSINTVNNATIRMYGNGEATTHIANTLETTLNVTNGTSSTFSLYLENGISEGGNITLGEAYRNNPYVIAKSETQGFTMSGGSIQGSDSSEFVHVDDFQSGNIDLGNGSNTFQFKTMGATASVRAGSGTNDTLIYDITINDAKMFADFIKTEWGFEKFQFTNMGTKGSLTGTDNDDTLTITNMNGGTLNGGDGSDYFNISYLNGGTINTGVDAHTDYITIEHKVHSDNGNDALITIRNSGTTRDTLVFNNGIGEGAKVTLVSSQGGFFIQEQTVFTFGFNMDGGSFTGSLAADQLYIKTLSGGAFSGAGGNDYIWLDDFSGGTLNAGVGADELTILGIQNSTALIETGYDADVDAVNLDFSSNENNLGTLTIRNSGSVKDTIDIRHTLEAGQNIVLQGNSGFTLERFSNAFNMNGGKITGSAHADDVYIGTMTAGNIHLGAGNDTVSIQNHRGGTINGGNGIDSVLINTSGDVNLSNYAHVLDTFVNFEAIAFAEIGSNETLFGTDSKDTAGVKSLNGGTIQAQKGADTINIETAHSGTVYTGEDAIADVITIENPLVTGNNNLTIDNQGSVRDTVYLTQGIGGSTEGEAGSLVLKNGNFIVAKSLTGTQYTGFVMNNGSLQGSEKVDTVHVSTMSGGLIALNGGNDAVTIATLNAGQLKTGLGKDTVTITNKITSAVSIESENDMQDNLYLTNGLSGGTLTLLSAASTSNNMGFAVAKSATQGFAMADGTINATQFADSIHIGTMTKGTVNAGAGDDLVKVANFNGGIINLGDGNDAFIVQNMKDILGGGNTIVDGGNGTDFIQHDITISTSTSVESLPLIFGSINFEGVKVTNLAGGAFVGTEANEVLGVQNVTGGTFSGADGDDTLYVDNLTGGTVLGGYGADTIYVTKASGGTVNTGGSSANAPSRDVVHFLEKIEAVNGKDVTITVTNTAADSDYVNFGEGIGEGGKVKLVTGKNSSLTLDGISSGDAALGLNMSGGSITGSDGKETVGIYKFTGGTVSLGANDDEISVIEGYKGTLMGGAGDDRISVWLNGDDIVVNGGMGADSFLFYNFINGDSKIELKGFNAAEGDTLKVNSDIVTDLATQAQARGEQSFTHEDVTIYFS